MLYQLLSCYNILLTIFFYCHNYLHLLMYKMNKFLLPLNLVLLAAVGYLYYLHYSYTSSDTHDKERTNNAIKNTNKVAYFELDSIQNNYEYFKEIRDYLSGKSKEYSDKLNNLRNKFQLRAKEYQEKGPSLSQTEQGTFQNELSRLQNEYVETEQDLNTKMQSENLEKMQSVKGKIQDYLKTFCTDKGYSFVFSSTPDDFMYYKDTLVNITNELITGLNERHKTDKAKK